MARRQVTSTKLTEAVADHLRTLIHRGEVGPAERLPPERELAEQLGVARISLREAIKQLRDEGYVEVRRGATGGTYVTELSQPAAAWRARMRTQDGEIDDILDFRIALETDTAALAARRHDTEDLVVLQKAVDALHAIDGRAVFRQADSQFHLALARAARSDRLAEAIEASRGELFSPHDLLPFVEPIEETLRDHQQILDAVAERDGDSAARIMRAHLNRTRAQLRHIVFGDGGDSTGSPEGETAAQARAGRPARGRGTSIRSDS